MDRNDDRVGSENNDQNLEAARHVEENRRALEEENQRVKASAPHVNDGQSDGAGRTGGGSTSGGRGTGGDNGGAGMQASEDNTQATAHVREAAANRDALEEEAQRVEATKPDDIDSTGRR